MIDPFGLDGRIYIRFADGTHFQQRIPTSPEAAAAQRRVEWKEIIDAFRKGGGDDFLITAATLPLGGGRVLCKVEAAFARELTARKALLAGEEALVKTGLKEAIKDLEIAAKRPILDAGKYPGELERAMEAYDKALAKAAPIQEYFSAAKKNLEKAIKESADAVREYLK
jgi:exonuclease VII small subunit